ncbi:hypothetical protein RRG08_049951, partial [Elysia crispata]
RKAGLSLVYVGRYGPGAQAQTPLIPSVKKTQPGAPALHVCDIFLQFTHKGHTVNPDSTYMHVWKGWPSEVIEIHTTETVTSVYIWASS